MLFFEKIKRIIIPRISTAVAIIIPVKTRAYEVIHTIHSIHTNLPEPYYESFFFPGEGESYERGRTVDNLRHLRQPDVRVIGRSGHGDVLVDDPEPLVRL